MSTVSTDYVLIPVDRCAAPPARRPRQPSPALANPRQPSPTLANPRQPSQSSPPSPPSRRPHTEPPALWHIIVSRRVAAWPRHTRRSSGARAARRRVLRCLPSPSRGITATRCSHSPQHAPASSASTRRDAPHAACHTPHATRHTPHAARRTPHATRRTPHAARLAVWGPARRPSRCIALVSPGTRPLSVVYMPCTCPCLCAHVGRGVLASVPVIPHANPHHHRLQRLARCLGGGGELARGHSKALPLFAPQRQLPIVHLRRIERQGVA